MSCWEVLEGRARAERDKAAEAASKVRERILEQQALSERTQRIAEQYQQKIEANQSSATHFGDIQLYRTSLKQMHQAIASIRTQIVTLEKELIRNKRVLSPTETESKKYQKLIERENQRLTQRIERREARELDEIGGQLQYRKSKLA